MPDVKSCGYWKTCTTKVERFCWSLTMMPSPPPLRARSSYAMGKSFLIFRRRVTPHALLWKVPGENTEACFSGATQYGPLSAAYDPDGTRNCSWNRFSHRPFLHRGSDQ